MNFNLEINSQYRPYDIKIPLSIMDRYQTDYEKQLAMQDQIYAALGQLETAVANSPKAKEIYDKYQSDLNAAAEALSSGVPLSEIHKQTVDLRRRYHKDILQLEQARQRMNEVLKLRDAFNNTNAGPYMVYEDLGVLDNYLEDQTRRPRYFSGASIVTQVGEQMANLGKALRTIRDFNQLDDYTKTSIEESGFTPEQVNDIIDQIRKGEIDNMNNPLIRSIINNTIASTGVADWGDESAIKKAYEYAAMGVPYLLQPAKITQRADTEAVAALELERANELARRNAVRAADAKKLQTIGENSSRFKPYEVTLNAEGKAFNPDDEKQQLQEYINKRYIDQNTGKLTQTGIDKLMEGPTTQTSHAPNVPPITISNPFYNFIYRYLDNSKWYEKGKKVDWNTADKNTKRRLYGQLPSISNYISDKIDKENPVNNYKSKGVRLDIEPADSDKWLRILENNSPHIAKWDDKTKTFSNGAAYKFEKDNNGKYTGYLSDLSVTPSGILLTYIDEDGDKQPIMLSPSIHRVEYDNLQNLSNNLTAINTLKSETTSPKQKQEAIAKLNVVLSQLWNYYDGSNGPIPNITLETLNSPIVKQAIEQVQNVIYASMYNSIGNIFRTTTVHKQDQKNPLDK